ncbi:MAG: hypothetical protein HYV09_26490 [Deltaproteobacteria bacterium]|nr:hypothetical protein [Deltaproteobacteria bacterium]
MSKIARSKSAPKKSTARPSVDAPVPYVPTPIDVAKVRTLADLGITPARAWALANHTHACSYDVHGLRAVSRVIHEEFGFVVLIVLRRDDAEEHDPGDVFALRHEAEVPTRGSPNPFVVTMPLGIGHVRDGRFIDNLAMSEENYREIAAAKGAA